MEPAPASQPAPQDLPAKPEFLAFAQTHFQTWVSASASNNPIWFHKCCFSFSTPKKRPKLNHPADQGEPLLRFLKKHKVKTPQEFASLLLDLSSARPAEQAGLLPTINEQHQEPVGLAKRPPPGELEALQQQVADQQATIDQLRQRLQLERTAAAEEEQRFLSSEFFVGMVVEEHERRGWKLPWPVMRELARDAAEDFRAAHPDIPSFGIIPRPDHANPSLSPLPRHPEFEDNIDAFLTPFLDTYNIRRRPK